MLRRFWGQSLVLFVVVRVMAKMGGKDLVI